jgi:hypothetical protein
VHTGFQWEDLRKRDHLEDPGIDERTIIKWILRDVGQGTWTGSIWPSVETGSIKFGKFLKEIRTW